MSKNKSNHSLLMDSLEIPNFSDIHEFSNKIGFSTTILYCLSKNTENYYTIKEIPKKDGTKRTIYIPSATLKIIQKWILVNILDKIKPTNSAMAFRKSNSKPAYNIKQNAYYHSQSLYGLSIDLKDFFTSIKSNKVYHIFRNIGYNKYASTILTNLCTLDGFLPQGAVCSPTLSNLVCINLDNRLIGLCEKRNILYTRYADDMYFSCDNKILLLRFYPIIEEIILDEDFTINKNKVCYQTRKNRRLITGVTVSYNNAIPELKASRELKRKIRAEIFKSIVTGDYSNKDHIKGEIAFVSFIEGQNYINNIKHYIAKSAKKIIWYPELVEAYNANLFYPNINKISCKSIKDLEIKIDKQDTDYYDEILFDTIETMYFDRINYLKKQKVQDICRYEEWPIEIFGEQF